MASCNQCGKEVGCGCNLLEGSCPTCYSKNIGNTDNGLSALLESKKYKKVRYQPPPPNPMPTNEFTELLRTNGLSKEEKLKRINDILDRASKLTKS